MNYSYLLPSGNPLHIFLLHCEDPNTRRMVVRPEYGDLRCPACGKLDELAAVRRGIDGNVAVRTRKDFVACFEWLICVSPKFKRVVLDSGISGLDFIPVPKSDDFSVIVPTRLTPTDLARSEMKLIGTPCPKCYRYRETLFEPAITAMALPPNVERGIFMPDIRPENGDCRISTLGATDEAVKLLRAQDITGIDWKAG